MELVHACGIKPKEVCADAKGNAAEGTSMRVLLDGPNFAMRVFTVRRGGHTPSHTHPWEHEVYVLSGKGTAEGAGDDAMLEISEGDAVYVAPDEVHSFVNAGEDEFRFICVIPKDVG